MMAISCITSKIYSAALSPRSSSNITTGSQPIRNGSLGAAANWKPWSAIRLCRCGSIPRPLTRAFQRREQLGEDFDRMLCLAVRWAGQRPALALPQRLKIDTDAGDDYAGNEALIEEFVERRLPTELPDILELSAKAEREIEAVRKRRSPELSAHASQREQRARPRQ
jgi:hypothetical protein